MSVARHADANGRHAPMWCDECGHTHDGTPNDIRGTLGHDGVVLANVAYARCTTPNGCGMLHTTHVHDDDGRVRRSMLGERPFGKHGKVRLTWSARTAQPTRTIRATTPTTRDQYRHDVSAREGRTRYEARTRVTDAVPSALPSPKRAARPVEVSSHAAALMARGAHGYVWEQRCAHTTNATPCADCFASRLK